MAIFRRRSGRGLPLGVHLRPGFVAVARMHVTSDGRYEAEYGDFVRCSPSIDAQTAALKMLAEKAGGASEIVLAAAPESVVVKLFAPRAKTSKATLRSAVDIMLNTLQNIAPPGDRIVAIDDIPDAPDKMVAVAKRSEMLAMQRIARAAGLQPIAIDNPLAAWQRNVGGSCDAVLETQNGTTTLYVFSKPLGEMYAIGTNLPNEAIVRDVRRIFVSARSERRGDVRSLRIVSDVGDDATLAKELAAVEFGLNVSALEIAHGPDAVVNPPWAFAAMLSTWAAN